MNIRKFPGKEVLGEVINEAFDIYTEREHWEIHCTRCDCTWLLAHRVAEHPGNLLFLLNHARMHDAAGQS